MDIQTNTGASRPIFIPEQSAFDEFLGQETVIEGDNPHATRYAYMPGVLYAQLEPRQTGYSFMPQGKLTGFKTLKSGGHYNSAFYEDKNARPLQISVSAYQALENAKGLLPVYEQLDGGFAWFDCLIGNDQAGRYFDALHPSFEAIGHECPFGLAVCPTCRLEWLTSKSCQEWTEQYIAQFALDRDIISQVKKILVDSNTRFQKFARWCWNDLVQKQREAQGGKGTMVLEEEHYHFRRCIHELTPEEKELEKIQLITAANANSFQAAFKGAGANGEVEQLVSIVKSQQAQIDALTVQVMGREEKPDCAAIKKDGLPCTKQAQTGSEFCQFHQQYEVN